MEVISASEHCLFNRDRREDNINSAHLYVKRSLREMESQRLYLKLRIVLFPSS